MMLVNLWQSSNSNHKGSTPIIKIAGPIMGTTTYIISNTSEKT